jgi:hypothetical protein
MKCWMGAESVVAALLLCAGVAAAAPRGWSADYQGALSAGRASGKHVLIAIVDSENCYASRAFRRDVVDNEGWADWREGNEESLLLVWWDRAEIPSRTWSDTAFLFVPGGAGGQLTTPLVAVISPDGMRAGPVMANSGDLDLLDFDDFTSAVDERLEAWGDVPPGELVWPTVTSASGLRARWSLDYQGSRDKGFAKQWPVLVALVDSGGASATTEAWVRGVLMTEAWQEWLDATNILLVWWDRAKISRARWDDVAFRFTGGGDSITLPQMVLFDTNGLKVDQFLAVSDGVDNLSRADDFISRLEDAMDWDGLQVGPGAVGFTASGQAVSASTNAVTVTVRRSGGASEGAQAFRLYTESGSETNKADAGVHYTAVDTQVSWAAGESGEKTVTVPLLAAEDLDVTVTQRVFHVKLEKGASATAMLGTADHTVTITYTAGKIGFVTNALTVYAGTTNVEVTVKRSGGVLGAQSVMLNTHAVGNVTNYVGTVNTNLSWASGESDDKQVLIPLKGDALDWGAALTEQVFSVALSKAAANVTATLGITNLAVKLQGSVTSKGDWKYSGANVWQVDTNTGRVSTLTWTAREGGWLEFAWCRNAGGGTLAVALPGVFTNPAVDEVTNRVAIAEGSNVVWTVTNCTATVRLLEWTPAVVQLVAPVDGASLVVTNETTVSWVAPLGTTTSHLYSAVSGVPNPLDVDEVYPYAATNTATITTSPSSTYNWHVVLEIAGALGTSARVMGPVWSFSFLKQKDVTVTAPPSVNAKASPNVVLYQYVPASLSVAERLEAARATRRYTARGLPSGLKINASTGVISGTPKRAGVSRATVKAAGAGAASVIELEIEVLACPAFALGEFQGMVLDDAGRVRGTLALKVSKTGALSGKIESGGRSRSLRGAWLDGGADARTIRLAAGRAEAMELSLTPEGVEGLTAEGWRVLARQLLSPQTAQQIAGSYTAVLRTEVADTPGAPAGYGYVTYTVAPRTRSVKYGGLLADGTRVSGSAKVVAGDGEGAALFPLYKGLYARRGEVSGVAVSMPDGGVVFGQGGWMSPGGGTSRQGSRVPFDAALDGEGARYAQPADWGALEGAWLTAGGQPFAALSAAGGKPVAQTAGVAFALTKRSGLFTGRFTDDDNMARAFKGVYMPALLYGAGFYLCPDDGGGTAPCSLPVELE